MILVMFQSTHPHGVGSVYLDFEGNVGDMLEEDIKDLEVYEK